MLFGQAAVAASLGEGSNYSWVVVSRNAAETGLEKNQYDAVLYFFRQYSYL